MGWLVQPLLFFLARCTRNQLIRQIEFLKAENEMLRKRVLKKHIHLEHNERELLFKRGHPIGADISTAFPLRSAWRWRFCASPKNSRVLPQNLNDLLDGPPHIDRR